MAVQQSRLIHLDMLRGLAALAVVIGHIRGFLLLDFGQLENPAIWQKPFYLLGGLGHPAVLAFFALSGFLVGGQALQRILSNSWSWQDYMLARLARLWTVVVPTLLLTVLMDSIGFRLGGGDGYNGVFNGQLSSGPTPAQPVDHSLLTLIANLLFLQTIVAPVYGSNGPLWSLANEFWYYVVFPLATAAILSTASGKLRLLSITLVLILASCLPGNLMILGAIWCAGSLAKYLTNLPKYRKVFRHFIYQLIAFSVVLASVTVGFFRTGVVHDLIVGFAFAMLLPALAFMESPGEKLGRLYRSVSTGLSEISYTLYATHFPILAFCYFVFVAPEQWPPGWAILGPATAMLATTLVVAVALWWCFERNTPSIKDWLNSLLRFNSGTTSSR